MTKTRRESKVVDRHPKAKGGIAAPSFRPPLPSYTIPDDALAMGPSLGNTAIWVTMKGTGTIQHVFEIGLGQILLDTLTIRYAGLGHSPLTGAAGAGHDPDEPSYVGLYQATTGTYDIHPGYQRHRFVIAGAVTVMETTFVPLGDVLSAGDPPVVYQIVELYNDNPTPSVLRIFGFARLRGSGTDDVYARYDSEIGALVAHNVGRPHIVRVFGATREPDGFATSFDFGRVYDPLHVRSLENTTEASGDVLGGIQVDLTLAPGETQRFAFVAAVSSQGEAAAVAAYRQAYEFEDVLTHTLGYLDQVLTSAQVLTPDPVINAGAMWSKVNMRRVMGRYPQGLAFTNEPGVSSNVVGRDVAWFVYGNDHFLPGFSRALLDTLARLQYATGKIPEYYSALDGSVEDYGLNINDDTPLFILAVNHHFRATGDADWLRRIYPAVVRASRYILSQEDERGLVFCSATDPRGDVWATASWRNVVPNYSINGAVTEINAECAAALRAAGHLAENLGQLEVEAQEFRAAAGLLRKTMTRHLLNRENGLYYLNIDTDGHVHTDVTGDEIFPVMFRVCDEEVGFRIISRLNAPDFWTAAGLRTASQNDPLYDPCQVVGLIGGVWPGLTWWYAFAAARYHPEFMVQALRSSFAHYAASPKANNTVPGQFSEWFDGESLVNRGMRLSPWEPPRFLWAAVEGVCGLMLTPGLPRIDPLVPPDWKWVALRELPYHGQPLTYFAVRHGMQFHVYANTDVQTAHQQERYDEDVSDDIQASSASAAIVALRRSDELVVLIGNVGPASCVVPVDLRKVIDQAQSYDIRIYNSERGSWEAGHGEKGRTAGTLAVSIETRGFRVIELKPRPGAVRA
ncbi:MAG: MGH1-like glycoside hydrolase domain-containing protein [Chloroflexota bacterium]